MKNPKFDDIRPYYEEEIPAAMHRIAASQSFPLLASYVYPNENIENVREMIKGYKTIADFQYEVMVKVNEQVIAQSMTEFTYGGLEQLDPNKNYLYVSNHRDIMLDSCLMQYILRINGHDTTEITFGANLMMHPLVIDIGKSNKMFKVERGGNIRDFYHHSFHLSEYIRYVINEKKQSVWIAQRNGRTKDGKDKTDQGIIKMFCMSKPENKIKALAELNIVPVAVSYEWEPCDILKTLELYESQQMKYIKKPGEDLNSILTGIVQPKGRVHIEFAQPISQDDLEAFDNQTNNEYHKNVATLLDERIISSYRLTPNNYIAHDLRYGQELYREFYTQEQKEAFIHHMCQLAQYDECALESLKDILLGIYANPIDSKLNVQSK
ncbi:1-acyl-sn-glycerol-3-phosphate acyltransferase [Porphyromonadaceae bacterium OttesenSCG-928-L07]|nr:1-acyl-sn-glycerol-3-phosphate acyltransferase [Porphyromonadaceae bacterium OttesenSCG-928-L07]MDL2251990.1 1-acyl-sn-glycerol-3-phosphate acyltransferase [Odoribacter sp. OttesenSCG-928-J03]MDL2330822.1 1-acyl-sn-glycerol-3-phosphate acyltransferase [Odoribacter sp. OttesenSCG-928-A06]